MTGSSPTFPAIEPPDEQAAAAALARQDTLTKPQGSLGRLEEIAVWLARWQGRAMPKLDRVEVIVLLARTASPRAAFRPSRPR